MVETVNSPKQSESPKATPRPLRVLIAEDSITSRTLLKNILQASGFEVATAVDGADALSQLKVGHFDLVVSDVEMPRMNGFELTRQSLLSLQKFGLGFWRTETSTR